MGSAADADVLARTTLPPAAAQAFLALPAYERRHGLAVHDAIVRGGRATPDLLAAALLHDAGKAPGSGARVRLPHRVCAVLVPALSPPAWRRLSQESAARWRAGFVLAAHHPRIGAELARAWGCDERICWLIAHHADAVPPDDPELAILVAADGGMPSLM